MITAATDSSRQGAFIRWLHRSYMQSSHVSYFLRRRITRIGMGVIAIFFISTAMAGGKPIASLFQVFGITSAILCSSLLWAYLRRADLSATRHLPRQAAAGQPLRYTVTLTNVGKRSIVDAWILESAPDPRPTLETFANSREPGEGKRNSFDRTFRFYRWLWLVDQLQVFKDSGAKQPLSLKPGESKTITLQWTPTRRGLVTLKDLRIILPDPLGIFQRCRKVQADEQTVTVYPKRYRVDASDIPGSPSLEPGVEQISQRLGASEEFAALRDYRPGDPIRLIHWHSWAKTGKVIVKEFEENRENRYGLFLDTLPNQAPSPQAFERAIEIAAFFGSSHTNSDALLDVLFTSEETFPITASAPDKRTEQIMTILADAKTSESFVADSLLTQLLTKRKDMTGCIFVMTNWDEERTELIKQIHKQGMKVRIIAIGVEKKDLQTHPSPAPVELLSLN